MILQLKIEWGLKVMGQMDKEMFLQVVHQLGLQVLLLGGVVIHQAVEMQVHLILVEAISLPVLVVKAVSLLM